MRGIKPIISLLKININNMRAITVLTIAFIALSCNNNLTIKAKRMHKYILDATETIEFIDSQGSSIKSENISLYPYYISSAFDHLQNVFDLEGKARDSDIVVLDNRFTGECIDSILTDTDDLRIFPRQIGKKERSLRLCMINR